MKNKTKVQLMNKNVRDNKLSYYTNKTRDIKTLLRLFPYLEDKSKAHLLKIDVDSMHYISIRDCADKISTIIVNCIKKNNMLESEISNIIITDATAGVGGNTLSFGKIFKKVYAIEINEKRCSYLENNVKIYNLNNVEIINGDCTKLLDKIEKQHIVFIDPPWGGKTYKYHNKLKLYLSKISLEKYCEILFDEKIMKCCPYMIILKLPKNYDIDHIYKKFKNKIIHLHDLEKMYIIVIIDNINK